MCCWLIGKRCTHDKELDKKLPVFLAHAAPVEMPSILEQLFVEGAQLAFLDFGVNRGVVFNCVKPTKDQIEETDGRSTNI